MLSHIHRNQRRFLSNLKQIHLQPEDPLHVLGDVIDRHPDGIRSLRRIMAVPNSRMFPGNHKYMMLRALVCPYDDNADDGGATAHWYRNGGKVIHGNLKCLCKTLSKEIMDYLRALPLNIDIKINERVTTASTTRLFRLPIERSNRLTGRDTP